MKSSSLFLATNSITTRYLPDFKSYMRFFYSFTTLRKHQTSNIFIVTSPLIKQSISRVIIFWTTFNGTFVVFGNRIVENILTILNTEEPKLCGAHPLVPYVPIRPVMLVHNNRLLEAYKFCRKGNELSHKSSDVLPCFSSWSLEWSGARHLNIKIQYILWRIQVLQLHHLTDENPECSNNF